jgi:hypothetical protein
VPQSLSQHSSSPLSQDQKQRARQFEDWWSTTFKNNIKKFGHTAAVFIPFVRRRPSGEQNQTK